MARSPQDGFGKEALLLDPDAALGDGAQKLGAGGARVVAGDQLADAGALALGQRQAAAAKARVGGGVHGDRLDGDADPPGQAAPDEDAGAIEIATVGDGYLGAGAQAQERDGGPAGLAAAADDQLVGAAGLDAVEKGRLVFDDQDPARGQLGDGGAAQLSQRQGHRLAQGGVAGDVVEALPALAIHERTKAVHRERGLVADDAADFERQAQGLALGQRAAAGKDGVAGGLVVIEEGAAEAGGALGAGGEGLAVAKHPGGEVGDAHRLAEREGGVDGAGDALGLEDGLVGAAAPGQLVRGAGAAGGGLGLGVEEGAGGGSAGAGAGRLEAADQAGGARGGLGDRVAARPAQGGIQEVVEAGVETVAAGALGQGQIDADAPGPGGAHGPGRHQLGEGGGGRGVGVDGDPGGQLAAPLAAVEDGVERGAQAGRALHQGANQPYDAIGAGHEREGSSSDQHAGALHEVRRLLGSERHAAFEAGLAPLLRRALDAEVTRVVHAERAPHYLNILYALLLFRRGHELEPRHDDLFARVLAPQRLLGAYDDQLFAQDLEQLCAWGAVERSTEAQRLRSYKDKRRVQYRYRLTDDAAALLEWLETRLAAKLEGRVKDSRDRLADVVGLLKEERRLLDAWRKGEGDADRARRAYYLLEAIGDAIAEIASELSAFRAEMIAFSQRAYDAGALREILGWLERYVELYLRRVSELHADIRDRLAQLAAPRYLAALGECAAAVEAERAAAPRLLRAQGPLRAPEELVGAAERFFRPSGRLAALCRAIDESARAVLLKMHRHVRELERRSARIDDLRATIRALAAAPDAAPGFADHLMASAHGRFDLRPGTLGHRVAPPAPRRHQLAADRRARSRPLAEKRAGVAEARALRAKAMAELAAWLGERVLAGAPRALLSQTGLSGHAELRRWVEVARAWHLGHGRGLEALGVRIEATRARARLGDDDCGLAAPDAAIAARKKEGGR